MYLEDLGNGLADLDFSESCIFDYPDRPPNTLPPDPIPVDPPDCYPYCEIPPEPPEPPEEEEEPPEEEEETEPPPGIPPGTMNLGQSSGMDMTHGVGQGSSAVVGGTAVGYSSLILNPPIAIGYFDPIPHDEAYWVWNINMNGQLMNLVVGDFEAIAPYVPGDIIWMGASAVTQPLNMYIIRVYRTSKPTYVRTGSGSVAAFFWFHKPTKNVWTYPPPP